MPLFTSFLQLLIPKIECFTTNAFNTPVNCKGAFPTFFDKVSSPKNFYNTKFLNMVLTTSDLGFFQEMVGRNGLLWVFFPLPQISNSKMFFLLCVKLFHIYICRFTNVKEFSELSNHY